MHVVAITRLATPVQREAVSLAAELGTLPYEQRLKLAAGIPAVILVTPDEHRATTLLAAIRGRGHGALRCLTTDAIASADMLALRHPQLEPGALVAAGVRPVRLRWEDIAVLVRATHRSSVETRTEISESRFSAARAALTGGLVTTKSVARTVTARTDELEAVLYIFPRTGAAPWLLREQHARFDALGDAATLTSAHNFTALVDVLRTRARAATFDDRLAARKGAPADVDLLAHLVASSVDVTGVSPFR